MSSTTTRKTRPRKDREPAVILVDLERDLRRRAGLPSRPRPRMTRDQERDDLARATAVARQHDDQLGPRSLVKPRLRPRMRCPDPTTCSISEWLRYALEEDPRSWVGIARESGVSARRIECFVIPPGRPGHRDLSLADAARLCRALGLRLISWILPDAIRQEGRSEEARRILRQIEAAR